MNYCAAFAAASRHILLLMLGLGLFLPPQWAFAKSPELYGQEYIRADQGWLDGSREGLPPPGEEVGNADETAYLEQVQMEELSGGPYSDALTEPLSSLGDYYRDQGNYTAAVDLYKRALHVVRVNDGLYSERQFPLVRHLLDTNRLAGDLQALDERYDYFFRLLGNGRPPYTELRLRATVEYLHWQREAFGLKLDGGRLSRLLDMYQLNKHILESVAQSTAVGRDWYHRLVLSQVRNLYLINAEIELPEEPYPFQQRRPLHSDQDQELNFKQRELMDIQRTSASKGRLLLQELIVRTASSGQAADLASIHLELGDWHQWNGIRRKAHQEYSIAVQILQDAGDIRLLQQWLGSPAELPIDASYWHSDGLAGNGRRVVLSAEYDVTARGSARNVQVYAENPEDEVFVTRLRRKLAATRFRPRFERGEAEAVERVSRKYELIVN